MAFFDGFDISMDKNPKKEVKKLPTSTKNSRGASSLRIADRSPSYNPVKDKPSITRLEERSISMRGPSIPQPVTATKIAKTVVDTNFEDSIFNEFETLTLEEREEVKHLLRQMDFSRTPTLMTFGDTVLFRMSKISDKLLLLSKGTDVNMMEHLINIRRAISSVGQTELLNKGAWGVIKGMFSLSAPRTDLQNALDNVDCATRKVEHVLPKVEEHVEKINELNNENEEATRHLLVFIIATKIALKMFVDRLRPEIAKEGQVMNKILQDVDLSKNVLEGRLAALLEAKISANLTPAQIQLMRTTYADSADLARNIIHGFVTTWKSHCATAIAILDSDDKSNFGSVAGDIIVTRDEIVKEIDKLL